LRRTTHSPNSIICNEIIKKAAYKIHEECFMLKILRRQRNKSLEKNDIIDEIGGLQEDDSSPVYGKLPLRS
jgi:hypothetical protein